MVLPCYLAMTAAEFTAVPPYRAWMACHFSPGGTGLSNLPSQLPKGTLLILDDALPFADHDPQKILQQLAGMQNWDLAGILLDLQRPGYQKVEGLCKLLVDTLSCPVIISELYAKPLPCPVFLPPPPILIPLRDYLAPWQSREIWLEAALDAQVVTVTESGSTISPCSSPHLPKPWFREKSLFCRYHWHLEENRAYFTISRTAEDLWDLFDCGKNFGVKAAVGLYQELQNKTSPDL